MQKRPKVGPRFRDRGEELLDYFFVDRNEDIRAACKKIVKGASKGLALYELIAERHRAADENGAGAHLPHRDFPNVQGLLWLFELELAVLLDDYLRTRGERRWFYARLLLLCLLESTKALRSVFSFRYRKAVAETFGGTTAAELSELHSFIHGLFEALNKTYGEIRQGLIAHRDPDAAVRFRLLETLSPVDIKDQAWEVLVWCARVEAIQKRYIGVLWRDPHRISLDRIGRLECPLLAASSRAKWLAEGANRVLRRPVLPCVRLRQETSDSKPRCSGRRCSLARNTAGG